MSYKISNQKGFAAIEAVLIVVILAIIGGTGYYVYQANNKSTDTQTAAQIDATTASGRKSPAAKVAQYTTISEWNVRAPYAGALKLQYTLSADGNQANFTSSQLLTVDAECTAGFGGQIDRYAPTDIATADGTGTTTAKERAASSDKSTYTYVGGYYYFFAHSQAACGADTAKTAPLQQETNDLVKVLVPKLQVIPKD